MADIFLCEDLNKLLKNKHVVFMGDSNVRAVYKDFLCLSQSSALIPLGILRQKMESTVFDDRLVYHGERTAARNYKEEREYNRNHVKVSFYFLTRVYQKYVLDILKDITYKKGKPDVIVINSCLWDITRWGPDGVEEYQKNLFKLMKEFKNCLSDDCLVIWLTTMPLSQEMKGGFLVQQLEFLKYSLRFHIMEANNFAKKVVVSHGYDVLDLHYHLRMQVLRRCRDGVHWDPQAVRYITNLVLTHISIAWDVPLPHRFKSSITSQILENINDENASDNQIPFIFTEKKLKAEEKPEHQEVPNFTPKSKNKRKKHKFQCHKFRTEGKFRRAPLLPNGQAFSNRNFNSQEPYRFGPWVTPDSGRNFNSQEPHHYGSWIPPESNRNFNSQAPYHFQSCAIPTHFDFSNYSSNRPPQPFVPQEPTFHSDRVDYQDYGYAQFY